jgi:hypothetical protein
MRRKSQPHQEEKLFDPGREVPGAISAEEIAHTDASDQEELHGITDTAKEEADLEEVAKLGGTALPVEVTIAEIEDLTALEIITDEELKRIDGIVNTRRLSRRKAEIIVLGEEKAAKLNGEESNKTSKDKEQEKGSYPGRYPYRSKSKTSKHPAKISQSVRTSGDANSGDPDLR